MQLRPYKDEYIVPVLVVMFALSILTIFWGANRGLGLGDEGLYLLAARYPDEIQQNVSSVYIYTGYLFQFTGFDPVGFRLSGVLIICISAFIFWLGLYRFIYEFYLKNRIVKSFRLYSLLFVELGALCHYQWFYMTPNYNTLIGIAISISSGSLLWGLAQTGNWEIKRKNIVLAFTFGGMSIGFTIFTKFPVGICFLILYFISISFWEGINRPQKITLLTSILVGTSIWFFVHFYFIQAPQTWWHMFKEGWELYQAYGVHEPQSKFVIYFEDLIFYSYSATKSYWPSFLILFTIYPYFIFRRGGQKISAEANSAIIFIVLSLMVLMSINAGVFIEARTTADGSLPVYHIFHFSWILILLSIWGFNLWCNLKGIMDHQFLNVNRNTIIVLGLLIGLPFAGAVGTANPLYNIPPVFPTAWFGAILLLLLLISLNGHYNYRLRLFTILSIASFTVSQIIQGYIYDPQLMIKTDLFQQTETTEVGYPVKSLKLDSQTHKLVNHLSSLARNNGFRPGDDIIAMHYVPGLVFAMGGRSPGHPTFLSDSINSQKYSELALSFADIERLKNAFVLINVKFDIAKTVLESRGIHFPDEYLELGAIDIRGKRYSLWKPVGISKG